MKRGSAAVFCLAAIVVSCGKHAQIALPPPTPARIGAVETGVASWYGHPYHGRSTSNGETYDMNALTAAHLSLPFDTMVRVTNVANGSFVDLRVNDRGPFLKERVIDVSRAAAHRLGMIASGTAHVRVEVVATPEMTRNAAWTPVSARAGTIETGPCDAASHGVQVASFRDESNAARGLTDLAARYSQARIVHAVTPIGLLHRLVVSAPDAVSARRTLEALQADGIQGFVTRLERNSACSPADAT